MTARNIAVGSHEVTFTSPYRYSGIRMRLEAIRAHGGKETALLW